MNDDLVMWSEVYGWEVKTVRIAEGKYRTTGRGFNCYSYTVADCVQAHNNISDALAESIRREQRAIELLETMGLEVDNGT